MKLLLAVCLSMLCAYPTHAQGAGRAIPIASENYVIEKFRTINPDIEYDTTNFLVDLSGNHANCRFVGRRTHRPINRITRTGESIGLLQDYTVGSETHTMAVDGYIRPVFDDWVRSIRISSAYAQIAQAKKFGCSVRPGCRGQVSVACLFSPYADGRAPTTTTRPPPPPTRPPTLPPPGPIYNGTQVAVAFTREQYTEAEFMTGQSWDKSYFLENLSGFETKCSLIGKFDHDFPYAEREAGTRGRRVKGMFGWAPNRGSTPDALREILTNMKQEALLSPIDELRGYFDPTLNVQNAKQVGCSLIADCIDSGASQMMVVVSCIFELSNLRV